MAVEEGIFFTGDISDRRYRADGLAGYFRKVLGSGVWELGDNLRVTADGTGMTVMVLFGSGMIDGFAYWLKDNGTGIKQLNVAPANTQPRIDRVVLRLDKSLLAGSIKLIVKTGTPAASPVPPTLTRAGDVYEISLSQVLVDAGVGAIVAGKITDERADTSVCGVCGLLVDAQTIGGKTPSDFLATNGTRYATGSVKTKVYGPHHAAMSDHSSAGVAVFGVGVDDATNFSAYVKIAQSLLQYWNGTSTYDIWHAGNRDLKKTVLYTGSTALAAGDYIFTGTADHDFYILYLTSDVNSAHHTSVFSYPGGYHYLFVNEYHVQKQLVCRFYSDRLTVTSYNGAWKLASVTGFKLS